MNPVRKLKTHSLEIAFCELHYPEKAEETSGNNRAILERLAIDGDFTQTLGSPLMNRLLTSMRDLGINFTESDKD